MLANCRVIIDKLEHFVNKIYNAKKKELENLVTGIGIETT